MTADSALNMSPKGTTSRELSADALDRFLDRLGGTRDEAAGRYNRTRERVVQFFRWQGLGPAEDLADDVLTRVARRLSDGEDVANVAAYVLGVARLVALEAGRQAARERRAIEEYGRHSTAIAPAAARERSLACLDRCLAHLTDENRRHVLSYYAADERQRIRHRHDMAAELGIGPVALRNRMLRLRQRIERCVGACLKDDGARDGTAPTRTSDRRGSIGNSGGGDGA